MIPIENIYFLLCYAWNRFDEGDMSEVAALECESAADLLASVLLRGVSRLMRKGLDRGYIPREDILSTVRGRIDVGYTGRHGLHRMGRALCRFDEFEHDVPHNQILKSTIRRLLHVRELDSAIKEKALGIYRRLPHITLTPFNPSAFRRLTLHRNNGSYRFLLHVCELIASYTMPEERQGSYHFREFLRDEKRMAYVFQQFIFNFLAQEQPEFDVKVDKLEWPAEELEGHEGEKGKLPSMETDISVRSSQRTLVIDTKYYSDILVSKRGWEPKVHAGNLYQMHAYLSSLETPPLRSLPDSIAEGMLLYPTNGTEVDLAWKIRGHTVRVRTIDLGQHWRTIRKSLLEITGP